MSAPDPDLHDAPEPFPIYWANSDYWMVPQGPGCFTLQARRWRNGRPIVRVKARRFPLARLSVWAARS